MEADVATEGSEEDRRQQHQQQEEVEEEVQQQREEEQLYLCYEEQLEGKKSRGKGHRTAWRQRFGDLNRTMGMHPMRLWWRICMC